MLFSVASLRLIPAVALAAGLLLCLKVMGWGQLLVGENTSKVSAPSTKAAAPAEPRFGEVLTRLRSPQPWEEKAKASRDDAIITGSAGGDKSADKPKADAAAEPAKSARPLDSLPANLGGLSASERSLVERLHERRQELEKRERDMDERQGLLEAAEKRLKEQLQELKATEARVQSLETARVEAEKNQIKPLVVMYEAMRAKDAARVFDRLEMPVLLELARMMNPRKLGDVMAQMQPENAERLTRELARKPQQAVQTETDLLPKIEGRGPAR